MTSAPRHSCSTCRRRTCIYADVDGNIGYQTPGLLPIRGAGDGSMPQPGWDSAYDWTGLHPVRGTAGARTTRPEGYIVTANNAIVAERLSVFPHAGLGLRLARGAHRRPAGAQGGDGTAHRRRHARHPGRQRVLRSASARLGLHGHLDGAGRVRSRAGPAAGVGCAERARTRPPPPTRTCCGTNSSCEHLRHGSRAPGAGHRPGATVPRGRRSARGPRL